MILAFTGSRVARETGELRTPLFIACQMGYPTLVTMLLDHQADPNLPLHIAAVANDAKLVSILLHDLPANDIAKENQCLTALHVCNMRRFLGLLEQVGSAGCNLMAQDASGRAAS